jgi:hypothetical protein
MGKGRGKAEGRGASGFRLGKTERRIMQILSSEPCGGPVKMADLAWRVAGRDPAPGESPKKACYSRYKAVLAAVKRLERKGLVRREETGCAPREGRSVLAILLAEEPERPRRRPLLAARRKRREEPPPSPEHRRLLREVRRVLGMRRQDPL